MRYVRIVCEGAKTEPNYFRGILKLYDWKGAQVVKAKDNSPVGIVRKAKEEYQKAVRAKIPREQIHVWAVFDRDNHANLKQALQEATAGHIRVAFSSVCFEYFILLHYERCTRPFENCEAVIDYLKEKYDANYHKRDDHFGSLKDLFQTAIDNNHWLLTKHLAFEETTGTAVADRNPYTDVYHLLKFLTGTSESNP